MNQAEVLIIAKDLVFTAALLIGPTIVISMLVGTIVSILQTITSIQEQTLSFAPRMIAVFAVVLLTLPWSLRVAVEFTHRMMHYATYVGR